MKIRVKVDDYEYMGLMKGSIHDAFVYTNSLGRVEYHLTVNGKKWSLYSTCVDPIPQECRSSYCECEEGKCSGGKVDVRADEARKIMEKGPIKPNSPIKSDGGSSTYYDLPVSEWLLYTLNERQKEGKCYIKTEEMISAFFGNDFSFGTALKSLVRAWGIKIGAGKAGNDMKYETSKIRYYADKILEQHEEKK